jgi:hypothetical protein
MGMLVFRRENWLETSNLRVPVIPICDGDNVDPRLVVCVPQGYRPVTEVVLVSERRL